MEKENEIIFSKGIVYEVYPFNDEDLKEDEDITLKTLNGQDAQEFFANDIIKLL